MIPEKVKGGDRVTLEGERVRVLTFLPLRMRRFTPDAGVHGGGRLKDVKVARFKGAHRLTNSASDGSLRLCHLVKRWDRQRLIAESRCAVFFVSPVSSERRNEIAAAAALGVDRSCHRSPAGIHGQGPRLAADISGSHQLPGWRRTFIAAEHPSQLRCG
jgi:hypothetical protein